MKTAPQSTVCVDSTAAYSAAKHGARYGHRSWLVWRAEQIWHTARLTADVLEGALATCATNEVGKPVLRIVEADTACVYNLSREGAALQVRNMRHYPF